MSIIQNWKLKVKIVQFWKVYVLCSARYYVISPRKHFFSHQLYKHYYIKRCFRKWSIRNSNNLQLTQSPNYQLEKLYRKLPWTFKLTVTIFLEILLQIQIVENSTFLWTFRIWVCWRPCKCLSNKTLWIRNNKLFIEKKWKKWQHECQKEIKIIKKGISTEPPAKGMEYLIRLYVVGLP